MSRYDIVVPPATVQQFVGGDDSQLCQQWNNERNADLERAARLERQLAVARKWYDEENPAEDGHDQVYPWDHVA